MELENFGFKNVHLTNQDKDSLHSIIRGFKPRLLLIASVFYYCCTPFMMKELLKIFPGLYIAALNIQDFPDDLAMKFITNGVKSYVNMLDGMDEFRRGLEKVREGKTYISKGVQESLESRSEYPMPAGNITERHIEVIRLLCCGFEDNEIADTLHITRRTVTTHKTKIKTWLNVRNSKELIGVALNLGIIKQNELIFYPRNYVLNPLPDKKPSRGRGK